MFNKVELCHIEKYYITLSHSELMQLMNEYKQTYDEKIKEKIIYANIKLVLSIITKYQQTNHSLDDLFQVGMIGLIKAIDYFDLTYQVRFSTYAHPLILGEVKRYMRESSSLRLPRSIHDLSYKILNIKEDYLKEYQKEISIEELSQRLKMDKIEVILALNAHNHISSLSSPLQNESQHTLELIDTIEDHRDIMNTINNHIALKDALKQLNDKERYIINQRYYQDRTQSEIASELMISQAQISREEKKALQHLRQLL